MTSTVIVKGYETSLSRKEAGVYKLVVPDTGQIYIGSTTDIHRRMIQHRHGFRHGNHSNVNLREALADRNEVVLEFSSIEGSLEDIRAAEETAIRQYVDSGKLLNVSLRPDCPMFGAHHSDESKQKIAIANRGKIVSEETRAKRSSSLMGVKHTHERKQNISDSMTKFSIIVDGVTYKNSEEAAKALGLKSKGAVRNRCMSPNYPNYSRVEI